MKVVPDIVLREHQKKQDLVALAREDIDDQEVHGFIVDFNKKWILIQNEYDFILDGLLLVKREFVTGIKHGDTQKFHKRLFQIEGKISEVGFERVLPQKADKKGELEVFLESIDDNKVVILENERDGLFLIGFVKGMNEEGEVEILSFDGVGKLDDEVSYISENELTKLTFDSSYCLHYERYFKRKMKRS
jgi:hypothetical protein